MTYLMTSTVNRIRKDRCDALKSSLEATLRKYQDVEVDLEKTMALAEENQKSCGRAIHQFLIDDIVALVGEVAELVKTFREMMRRSYNMTQLPTVLQATRHTVC